MTQPSRRREAAVGATGVAGQQLLDRLDGHPLFEAVALAASVRSAGEPYLGAVAEPGSQQRWACDRPLPQAFAEAPPRPNGVEFVLLSHDTEMGFAKGACLVAEYLVHEGPGGVRPENPRHLAYQGPNRHYVHRGDECVPVERLGIRQSQGEERDP